MILTCPTCGGTNNSVQFVNTGGKSKTNHVSPILRWGRAIMIICTCGLWILVPKRKENTKIITKNQKVAICNCCGYSWNI